MASFALTGWAAARRWDPHAYVESELQAVRIPPDEALWTFSLSLRLFSHVVISSMR
jgi:hypothetical protein